MSWLLCHLSLSVTLFVLILSDMMPEELFKKVKLKHPDGPPGGWLRYERLHLSRESRNSKLANLSFCKVICVKIGNFITQIFGKFLIFNHRIAMNQFG